MRRKREISILYVEDDPAVRSETEHFLRRYAGKKLVIAEDGEAGLKRYRESQPDLVISDIIMPRLNGIEMVRAIREIHPEQPVIFTTANTESSLFVDMVALQVDAYVPKPIDLDLLGESIERVMRRAEIEREYRRQKTILNEIARLQANYLAVFDREGRPIFLNESMQKRLGVGERDNPKTVLERIQREFFPGTSDQQERWFDRIERIAEKEFYTTGEGDSAASYRIDLRRVEETGHTILSLSEVTKVMEERRAFERRATRDELTGLRNRYGFNREVVERMIESLEKGRSLSLILADLDHFKSINDRYGHLVGDEALTDFAHFLRREAPDESTVARWGGEEFVVLLPGKSIEEALEIAERIRQKMHTERFASPGLSMTASFGVARQHSLEETPTTLLKRADSALYRAKESGRDRVATENLLQESTPKASPDKLK